MNPRFVSPTCVIPRLLVFPAFAGLLFLAPAVRGQELLIGEGDQWRFLKGTEEPPRDWLELGFDDTAWETGPSGFGYGDGDDATTLNDMQNNYVSVYIRAIFPIPDLSQAKVLMLQMKYDDGYVAYVNGVEIGRSTNLGAVGTPVPFDMMTTADHEVNATPEATVFPVEAMEALKAGDNVLAIQGHNTSLTSSDFSLIPQLQVYTEACPTNFACTERDDGSVRLSWRHVLNPPPYESVEIVRNGEVISLLSNVRATTFTDAEPRRGENVYELQALLAGGQPCGAEIPTCTIVIIGGGPTFRRGDADDDGMVRINDSVFTLLWLFQSGTPPTCQDAADMDDDGLVRITDAVFLLLHLFRGGAPPPAPGIVECGPDGTDDTLEDCVYTSCE